VGCRGPAPDWLDSRVSARDAGLIIIVNVGDQYSDLRGGQTGLAS
jgi:hypothetical protein